MGTTVEAGQISERSETMPIIVPKPWQDVLNQETAKITDEKIRLARELGVPAVLFTEEQINERIEALAEYETVRTASENAAKGLLYIVVGNGGWPLATDIFNTLARHDPKKPVIPCTLEADSRYRANDIWELIMRRRLGDEITLYQRDVVLIDVAIRSGSTLKAIKYCFNDPEWTVNNRFIGGAPPESISAVSLMQREDVEMAQFEPHELATGFLTPKGVDIVGKGADTYGEINRFYPNILVSNYQKKPNKLAVESALAQIIGDESSAAMDAINWE